MSEPAGAEVRLQGAGRDLVLMLIDLVSRGGNLLLDIGPDGDGTIPVIMQQRLLEIGEWMKVNGEASYGTKPWKTTRQWRAGEQPKTEYGKEFTAAYDVKKLASKPEAGKAGIEAFFTTKGNDLYVILPRWSGRTFQVKDVSGAKAASVLCGGTLNDKAAAGGVAVGWGDLP